MPDATTGILTENDKQTVTDWLSKTNWKDHGVCPVCGATDWIIGDHIVQPATLVGKSLRQDATGYPQVMLISGRCGYTMYLNAVVIGLLPGSPQRKGI